MEEKIKNEIEECETAPQIVSILRKIIVNVLGFIAGYYAGALAFLLARWLFFDVLGEISIIRSILSQPVDYGVYAITGVIFIDAMVSLKICGLISKF